MSNIIAYFLSQIESIFRYSLFVGEGRLELPSLAALVPKTSAYTNSATRPYLNVVNTILHFCRVTNTNLKDY